MYTILQEMGLVPRNKISPHPTDIFINEFHRWTLEMIHFKSTRFLTILIIHYSLVTKMTHVLVPQTWSVNQRV